MNLLAPIPRLFPGRTVVCIAPGPSLTVEDCERCRGQAVVAVGDGVRLAPFADVLYHADDSWWKYYDGVPSFRGMKITFSMEAAQRFGLHRVAVKVKNSGFGYRGVSFEPNYVHSGGNSGFQALNLAVLFGARRIVLLGYDMKGSHFFGEHPRPLRNREPNPKWRDAFAEAAPMLAERGVEVLNATRSTALTCFPRVNLDDALCDTTVPA
jgi:hypothetical protein